MFILHYVLPLVILLILKEKIMFWGLIIGNLIDLDHIYYRIIGKVGWFESACGKIGRECSLNFYPLHNWYIGIFGLVIGIVLLFAFEEWWIKLIGWAFIGVFLHLCLDYVSTITQIVI